jgi:hypothetical protein
MKKILLFSVLVAIAGNAGATSLLTEASATWTTIKFTSQLSENLTTGYKVKIDLNNGKGFVAMKCSALTCTLSSNALPKGVDDASYSVGIYDSKGALQGETIDGSYVITTTTEVNAIPTAPPVNTVPTTSTGYTKISNSGATLPDIAQLGTGSNDWTCTKDNKTGLIWEVKTTDGGLRDMENRYSWYQPDASKNAGGAGSRNVDPYSCKGSECDTYAFTNAVNKKKLCGKSDWRIPTKYELTSISNSTVGMTYFPNSKTWFFWSSSSNGNNNNQAWGVQFEDAFPDFYWKSEHDSYIRLVRN